MFVRTILEDFGVNGWINIKINPENREAWTLYGCDNEL